jgi:diphthine-ammonia ligase
MRMKATSSEKSINMNALCSWSGGKDSCYALMKAIEQGFSPKVLLNVLNENGKISRSHGIPSDILHAQAKAAQLPIHLIQSSWQNYEMNFTSALQQLKTEYDLQAAVFGDIDLQAHRDWEEKVCNNAGLQAILPIWQQDRETLVMQMLNGGMKTMIVSCNEKMGESFLGKTMNEDVIEQLKAIDIDVCGENGEFHTLVLNCSLFSHPLNIEITSTIKHDNYWFCEPILL